MHDSTAWLSKLLRAATLGSTDCQMLKAKLPVCGRASMEAFRRVVDRFST